MNNNYKLFLHEYQSLRQVVQKYNNLDFLVPVELEDHCTFFPTVS